MLLAVYVSGTLASLAVIICGKNRISNPLSIRGHQPPGHRHRLLLC
jgi:hypothetical protein